MGFNAFCYKWLIVFNRDKAIKQVQGFGADSSPSSLNIAAGVEIY